jgi:hypothetical protein
MFPHSVTITHAVYPKGQTGGSARSDGTSTTLSANVQSAGMDKSMRVPGDDTDSVQGVAIYDVSFPSDPGVAVDDTITWDGPPLQVQSVASPAFRGRLFRVRCVSRT